MYDEFMQDYPRLIPCIYCDYWRTLIGNHRVTKTMGKAHELPCCHYSRITGELRGIWPYDGKCHKFKAGKRFSHLQEVYERK